MTNYLRGDFMIRISFALSCLSLVALAGCHTVSAADTAPMLGPRFHLEKRIPGPDGGWDFATFDAAHGRVYIARANGVTALDVATGTLTPQLVAGSRTHIALPINNGSEILVTNGADGTAFIANALTGGVRVPAIPTGSKPDSALLEPTTGLVWVMDNHGGGITMIDPHAGAVVGTIALPGALESPVSDGMGKVFVTVEDLGEIAVLDAKTRSVAAHWRLAGCEEPTGLALDPGSRRLVAECANGTAKIVSIDSGETVTGVPIGLRPDALTYDARRRLMYAPTGGDGMMSVIDPVRARIVAIVATQTGCRGATLDPRSGKLYLPAGRFAPPATEGARPTLMPGSFEVLVLHP